MVNSFETIPPEISLTNQVIKDLYRWKNWQDGKISGCIEICIHAKKELIDKKDSLLKVRWKRTGGVKETTNECKEHSFLVTESLSNERPNIISVDQCFKEWK